MTEHHAVQFEREDGLAIIRLNRPDRMNAITSAMLDQLCESVPELTSDPGVRAILLTGNGRAFCAGGDVGVMGGATREATLAGMKKAQAFVRALRTSDKPVVTAVNGAAAGGGFGIAMLGDIILASDSAIFKGGFSALGASADYGLAFTLPMAVGALKAAEILLLDQKISASEALEMGLVTRVIPADRFADDALSIARQLAGSPRSTQIIKHLLRLNERAQLEAYFEAEAIGQADAFQSSDFIEGVAAFREKRAACFTGN